jgi:hypothetical protein
MLEKEIGNEQLVKLLGEPMSCEERLSHAI